MNYELLNLLKSHTGSPIKRRDLANQLGISQRDLRFDLSELNKDGQPVLSDNSGVYFCLDEKIISRVAARYFSMGTKTLTKARALESTAQRIRNENHQGVLYETRPERVIL